MRNTSYKPVLLFIVGLFIILGISSLITYKIHDHIAVISHDQSQWYGVFLYGFGHESMQHYFGNMFGIMLGSFLIGTWSFRAMLYCVPLSLVLGGIFAYFFTEPQSMTIGASGISYGLMTVGIGVGFIVGTQQSIINSLILLAGNVGLFFGMIPSVSNEVGRVSWQAHAGGAIAGVIILGFILYDKNRGSSHLVLQD